MSQSKAFCIALAAVGFGRLHLAHQPFAPLQQFVSV